MGCSNTATTEINIKQEEKELTSFNVDPNNPVFIEKRKILCILTTSDGKILMGTRDGKIIVYKTWKCDEKYELNIFGNSVQAIIELPNKYLAGCSNDKTVKIFNIKNDQAEIIKTFECLGQVWAMINYINGGIIYGDIIGEFKHIEYKNRNYEIEYSSLVHQKNILNLIYLYDKVIGIVYLGEGLVFYDLEQEDELGTLEICYPCPPNLSVLKISDHELLLGGELKVNVVDYKERKLVNLIDIRTCYCFYQLSKNILLINEGEGNLRTYQISRDNKGDLIFDLKDEKVIHDSVIIGIARLANHRFLTFDIDHDYRLWQAQ